MEVKYVGFYDHISNESQSRSYALPAAAKMEYIAGVLSRLGDDVLIVSPSPTTAKESFPGHVQEIMPGVKVKLFTTWPSGHKVRRILSVLHSRLSLLGYLLTQTRPGEPVIVYHSLAIQEIMLLAKALRRFSLILEVEEVYQDVVDARWWKRWAEWRLFSRADAFILSTDLLGKTVNGQGKPAAVVYGDYRLSEPRGPGRERVPGRVVYAGTFDPRKGGAAAAAAAAAHLDENFEVHILGFGTAEDVENMKRAVEEANSAGGARVQYHGTLKGDDYSEFLGTCEIGLSTQSPTARFNQTSFPSKILSYMAHGLKVVSVRIPAVEESGVGADVTYYERQEPREIAEAIRRAAASQSASGDDVLRRLDKEFNQQLEKLLVSVRSVTQGKASERRDGRVSDRNPNVD